MNRQKKYSMKLKQLSEIPQGILQNPANHPVDNLAARGGVPLGQSGAQMMDPTAQNAGNTGALLPR